MTEQDEQWLKQWFAERADIAGVAVGRNCDPVPGQMSLRVFSIFAPADIAGEPESATCNMCISTVEWDQWSPELRLERLDGRWRNLVAALWEFICRDRIEARLERLKAEASFSR